MQHRKDMRFVAKIFLCASAAMGLSSCTDLQYRRGISPILDASAVETASANKLRLMTALARDAGVFAPGAGVGTLPVPSPLWYYVARAGFNVVDDQCRAYFDELFFLNRGREQTKSGIVSAGQTAAAILGVTGASSLSLGVLAQAVGFGVNTTELIAGTYLYQLPPATTHGFVQQLQSAFRDAAEVERAAINNPEAAYYLVQRYLDLCLPPRIEAEITKQIGSATAIGVQQGSGAFFRLETVKTPADVVFPAPSQGERPSRGDPVPPIRRRGTLRQNPSLEERCSAGDAICRNLVGYLFEGGPLSTERLRQFSKTLAAIDATLERRVFEVIKGGRLDPQRQALVDVVQNNPIAP